MKQRLSGSRLARYWTPFNSERVECTLCPRHCRPKNNRDGYCGVRGAVDGALHSFNYGKSLAATEEVIETEAINHYSPGARILSMGNIGCMMSCSFCQNWETSQIKHLDQQLVRDYSPQQVVDICLENRIEIISWTYNDPVVWHEFVVDTSRLAQENGLKTLYKSAFYIEEEPVNELIDCIDIFSLSLKSMNPVFYQKITKARLAPVLERIKQVHQSRRHLEISQLVIPELNDADEDIKATAEWVVKNIGSEVPLHFVAFHPAYKYTHVERTSIDTLLRARKVAKQMGIRYVYLGNTYRMDLNDTLCQSCGATLVRRYGLAAETVGLNEASRCTGCGEMSPITNPWGGRQGSTILGGHKDLQRSIRFLWNAEVQSAHVMRTDGNAGDDKLRIRRIGSHSVTEREMQHGLDRFIVSRQGSEDKGIVISWDSDKQYQFFPVLDRAHFPVSSENQERIIPIKRVGT